MPETKDLTLEQIDQLFQMPTRQLVRKNAKNAWEVTNDLLHFRFRKVFIENNQRRYE